MNTVAMTWNLIKIWMEQISERIMHIGDREERIHSHIVNKWIWKRPAMVENKTNTQTNKKSDWKLS